jgi:hypothetical protein
MATFTAEEYKQETATVAEWPVNITSYKILDRYLCKIDNVSPGAVIARGEGTSREDAISDAMSRATRRLKLSRTIVEARREIDAISARPPNSLRPELQAVSNRLKGADED